MLHICDMGTAADNARCATSRMDLARSVTSSGIIIYMISLHATGCCLKSAHKEMGCCCWGVGSLGEKTLHFQSGVVLWGGIKAQKVEKVGFAVHRASFVFF